MRFKQVLAAGTALGLLGAVSTFGPAGAAPAPGVGTTQASTTVLSAEIGQLLNLKLLGDEARSTIDRQVAAPEAYSRFVGADIKSALVPALNLSIPAAPVEARSPGGEPNKDIQSASLAAPLPVAVPVSVLGGTLDAALRTSLTDVLATSGIDATLKNVNLVGGLVSVEGLSSTLSATAAQATADGARGVKVGAIDVLDLGALLDGLDLKLTDLPVSTVTGLVGQLGLPVNGVPSGTDLTSYVSSLNTAVSQVQGTIDQASGQVTGTVPAPVASLLTSLALPVPDTNSTVSQVTSVVGSLQGTLDGVLGSALNALDGTSLLKLGGLDISVITKATDSVSSSVADVQATLGAISVGNVTIPGTDIGAVASQVSGVVNQVNSTLSGVLSTISPDLANLVSVSVLDQVESVTQSGGYTRSRAGITGLTASIVPPANLSALVDSITGAVGVGEVITGMGGQLPVLSTAMSTFESTTGVISALTGGATIKVAEVASASDFATGAAFAPAPVSELPRTGGVAPFALIGLLMAATGLGLRRTMASAVKA